MTENKAQDKYNALEYLKTAYEACECGFFGTLAETGRPDIWVLVGTRREISDAVNNSFLFPKSETDGKKEQSE